MDTEKFEKCESQEVLENMSSGFCSKNLEIQPERSDATYGKRLGVNKMFGAMYEVKMCIFLMLKLLNIGARFNLCSNLKQAGDFDDIVVRYFYKTENSKEKEEVLFIQLKHAEKDNVKRTLAFFTGKKANFNLQKYFLSFCSIHNNVQSDHRIFQSDPSNRTYLIYTNADVHRDICQKTTVDGILDEIALKGDVLMVDEQLIPDVEQYKCFCNMAYNIPSNKKDDDSIVDFKNEINCILNNVKDDNFRNLLEGIRDKKLNEDIVNKYRQINTKMFDDFIKHTKVCCNQINVDDLDDIIKREIRKYFKVGPNETNKVYTDLIKRVTFWWENESYYLTEDSILLKEVLRDVEASRFQFRSIELDNLGMKYCDNVLAQLQKELFLNNARVLNIECGGEMTVSTTLKVWQTLLQSRKRKNFILVNVKDCTEDAHHLWATWPNWWCQYLVIECTNEVRTSKWLICKLYKVLTSSPSSNIIFISPQSCNWPSELEHLGISYCKINDVSLFHQLDEQSQTKLENRNISFQGEIIKLSDLLEPEDLRILPSDIFANLMSSKIMLLGKDLKQLQLKEYVNRCLSIPYIKKEIFELHGKDIIAVEINQKIPGFNIPTNVQFCSVTELQDNLFLGRHGIFDRESTTRPPKSVSMKSEKTFSSNNTDTKNDRMHFPRGYSNTELLPGKCKYVILKQREEEKEYNVLCSLFNNVHWIVTHGQKFIWKKTRGNISTIRDYLEESEHYVTEKDFIEVAPESPVLIAGDPGIGKSTLLNHLSLSLKCRFCDKWIATVNLSQHCTFLSTIGSVSDDEVINIIRNSLGFCKTEFQSLPITVNKLRSYIILLDAFDEISPDFTEKVKLIIQRLCTLCHSVYVTSRNSMVPYLEKELSVVSCNLQPLDNESQHEYLSNIWKIHHPGFSEEQIQKYVTEALNIFFSTFSGSRNVFTGNPLHIRILAETYSNKLCMISGNQNISIKAIFNILQLFTEFVAKKCKLLFSDKKSVNILSPLNSYDIEQFTQKFVRENKYVAALQIFGEKELGHHQANIMSSKALSYLDSIQRGLEKTGIIDSISNGMIKYIHRSFAEYFAALWLADNLKENKAIVQETIFQKGFELVRMFFDLQIAERCSIHTAVLMQDYNQVLNVDCDDLHSTDAMGRTALHLAAAYNDLQMVKQLVEKTSYIIIKEKFGWSPLMYAAATHSWEVMDFLLEKVHDEKEQQGHNILRLEGIRKVSEYSRERKHIWKTVSKFKNELIMISCIKSLENILALVNRYSSLKKSFSISHSATYDMATKTQFHKYQSNNKLNTFIPIHFAAQHNNPDMINLLLKYGCNLNQTDDDGHTVLHIASCNGYLEMVNLLLEKGLTVNTKSAKCGFTPLHIAAMEGNTEIMKVLLEHKADIHEEDRQGNTALLMASQNGHLDIVKYCVNQNANANHCNIHGNTALLLASQAGHLDIVKFCTGHRFNLNQHNRYGSTALLLAAQYGHLEIIKWIMAHGCDIDSSTKSGITTLLLAARYGYIDIVEYCLELGADVNCSDKTGYTPTQLASRHGYIDIVKHCVSVGADVNACNEDGSTALLFAAYNGYFDIAKYLIENGADTNHKNTDGISPLLIAARNGHADIVKLCVQEGADVNCCDKFGNTPLLLASKEGYLDIVRFCAEHGADINPSNCIGDTPMLLAVKGRHFDIVRYFLDDWEV